MKNKEVRILQFYVEEQKFMYNLPFTKHKRELVMSYKLRVTIYNQLTRYELTRNDTRMKRMKRLTGNFVTVEMQQSCVEKLKG